MIQVVTTLESLYFSSMIPDLEVNCYDWLDFTLTRGGEEILKERYWANNNSRVWIRKLGNVIAADLGSVDGLTATYNLKFADDSTTDSKSINVILGEQQLGVNAVTFTANNFLTMLSDWKYTHDWQTEILSMYLTASTAVTLEYWEHTGGRVGPANIRTVSTVNKVVEINVSPESLFANPENIDRYIIRAGNRQMMYVLRQQDRLGEPELIFRNAFGCRESFVPVGLVERQNEYENSTGYIRDMLFRFRTKEIKKFEANTGILTNEQANWAEDMIVSNELFLKMSDDLIPVTVTDAKVSRTNATDELISFDFNYQLSQPSLYGAGKIDIKRIFDDTFDYTFH